MILSVLYIKVVNKIKFNVINYDDIQLYSFTVDNL